MTAKEHVERLKKDAIEAFSKHELVRCDEDRWIIKLRYKDGKGFESTFATEVISLMGGRLFVGGDIPDCTFAYFSDSASPRERLIWIGKCTDVDGYVRQKASMGLSDGGKCTTKYSPEVARSQLEDIIEEDDVEASENPRVEVLKEALAHVEDQHNLLEFVYDQIVDCELGYLGEVVSARVVYAWAAVRRLCELLDEGDKVHYRNGLEV